MTGNEFNSSVITWIITVFIIHFRLRLIKRKLLQTRLYPYNMGSHWIHSSCCKSFVFKQFAYAYRCCHYVNFEASRRLPVFSFNACIYFVCFGVFPVLLFTSVQSENLKESEIKFLMKKKQGLYS